VRVPHLQVYASGTGNRRHPLYFLGYPRVLTYPRADLQMALC
jgi:hypothetical protein